MEDQQARIDSGVREKFKVKDLFLLPDGELEYKVVYDIDTKEKFERLFQELKVLGFVPRLVGTKEDCNLIITKRKEKRTSASRVPVVLLLLTLTSLLIFGLLQSIFLYQSVQPAPPAYIVTIAYTLPIIAIMITKEMMHWYASRKRGLGAPVPYFIFGIPYLTSFLPTLGSILVPSEEPVNRDRWFEVCFYGPIFAVLLASILYAFEVSTLFLSFPINLESIQAIAINPNLIQIFIDRLLGGITQTQGNVVLASPIADAATVGFTVSFITLLPILHMSGGHMIESVFSYRAARIGTYLSTILLFALDTPQYFFIAILLLFMSGAPFHTKMLDEVSEVSKSKKILLALSLLLAFLCVPIPHNIFSLNLG